ncbi:hypothetical protein EC912_101483 [Luteibacter rhizovicinus]|uniref:Uncharacterized protein n=1 Tax=Luteibacter rhizovicinus TaxID=242606 RepID=A0A4R3YXL5_9GAMM|nr:hypothetical protein [Luteibacter rhizovicinus]TCV97471.1 hypothetical protein EC912_101483 [Luteibacter rhizovicinus]
MSLHNDSQHTTSTFEDSNGYRHFSAGSSGVDLFEGELDGYDWLSEVASRLHDHPASV